MSRPDTAPDPALWFTLPMSRAMVLGVTQAIRAGHPSSVEDGYAGCALGVLGEMEDWLRDVSTQRLEGE